MAKKREERRRNTLDRWSAEKAHMHRGLLLFAMMDRGSSTHHTAVEGRSMAPVAKATGYDRTSVRRWSKDKQWRRRIRYHRSQAQAYAIELYRRLYLDDFGDNDIPVVGEFISLPLDEPAISEHSKEETVRLMRALTPDAPEEDIQKRAEAARLKARKAKLEDNTSIRFTTKQAIKAIENGLRAATDKDFAEKNPHITPLVPRAGELPVFHKLLKELEEERERLENPEIVQAGGGSSVESVRVRIAKETGGSVLEAILADCREILAIGDQLQQPDRSVQDIERENQETSHGVENDRARPHQTG